MSGARFFHNVMFIRTLDCAQICGSSSACMGFPSSSPGFSSSGFPSSSFHHQDPHHHRAFISGSRYSCSASAAASASPSTPSPSPYSSSDDANIIIAIITIISIINIISSSASLHRSNFGPNHPRGSNLQVPKGDLARGVFPAQGCNAGNNSRAHC